MKNYDAGRKVFVQFFVALSILLAGVSGVWAYSGGDGTEENPYQIADANDWLELTTDAGNWDKNFILIADVNLAGTDITPIGNTATKFTGVFDGNDHAIRNVMIGLPAVDCVGLFGYCLGGQITKLGVENVNINSRNYVGGLVGYNDGGRTTGSTAARPAARSSRTARSSGRRPRATGQARRGGCRRSGRAKYNQWDYY